MMSTEKFTKEKWQTTSRCFQVSCSIDYLRTSYASSTGHGFNVPIKNLYSGFDAKKMTINLKRNFIPGQLYHRKPVDSKLFGVHLRVFDRPGHDYWFGARCGTRRQITRRDAPAPPPPRPPPVRPTPPLPPRARYLTSLNLFWGRRRRRRRNGRPVVTLVLLAYGVAVAGRGGPDGARGRGCRRRNFLTRTSANFVSSRCYTVQLRRSIFEMCLILLPRPQVGFWTGKRAWCGETRNWIGSLLNK